jgi:hypothetical protein
MYIVEWVQNRSSKDVKWLVHEKLDQLNEIRNESQGFVGKSVFMSDDKLVRTVVTKWTDAESSENFFITNEELIEECNILTLVYNQQNGITLERSAREE